MRNDPSKLRTLAKRMGRQVVASPMPVNQALLDCFDHVIAPDEADLLLAMGESPRSAPEVAALAGLDAQAAERVLASALGKDLVTRRTVGGAPIYELSPYMPGWFETQLFGGGETEYHQEFARRIDKLFKTFRDQNVLPVRLLAGLYLKAFTPAYQSIAVGAPRPTSKRVQVDRGIEVPASEIHPTDTVLGLIEKHGHNQEIALVHCFCRQWKKMMGEPCRFHVPQEACILLGRQARYFVEQGPARAISRDEALAIVLAAQKGGAVHTVFHERDEVSGPEMAICNCCWDCCGLFGSYNRGGGVAHLKCSWRAVLSDAALCTRCGRCVKHCPVDALALTEQGLRLDDRLCIGCGQCAFQCAPGALSMRADERDVVLGLIDPKKARIQPR